MISLPQTDSASVFFTCETAGLYQFAYSGGVRNISLTRAADSSRVPVDVHLHDAISVPFQVNGAFCVYLHAGDILDATDGVGEGLPNSRPASIAGVRLGDELSD